MVLQERANAVRSGTVPRSKRSALGTGRPPITVLPGQATGESADSRCSVTAAAAVAILNVEPGGYRPASAGAPTASAALFCATASRSPVDGATATSMVCCGTGSTASSAALCTARSSPTVIVVPGSARSSTRVTTTPPAGSTACTDQPATPSS